VKPGGPLTRQASQRAEAHANPGNTDPGNTDLGSDNLGDTDPDSTPCGDDPVDPPLEEPSNLLVWSTLDPTATSFVPSKSCI
jgi:hypothetical protein